MKTSATLLASVAVFAGFVSAMSLLSGCEEASGLRGLLVSPENVTLPVGSNTVVFTVTGGVTNELALPFEWWVSNPSLGSIIGASGRSATYRRSDNNGENVVTVRDQYDNEGYAVVKQTAANYSLTLTADATSLSATNDTATITADGGQAPFRWWVQNSAVGRIISGRDSDTAVYRATAAGVNVVHAEDVNGVLGTVAIRRE